MKKLIIKVALFAFLLGGIAFNLNSISSSKFFNSNELKSILKLSTAQAENVTAKCTRDVDGVCCVSGTACVCSL